jgi:hypothetical protein
MSWLLVQCDLQRANERIECLERRLRRQTRGLILGVVLAAATSLLIGQTGSKRVVEAGEFILRGPQGQELATLDSFGTGAALTLYDSKHRVRIAVTTHEDTEPGVIVYDSNAKSSAVMGVSNNNPFVQLQDQQERTRADIALTPEGPAVRMWDSASVMRAAITIHNEVPMVTVASGADSKKGGVILAGDNSGGHVMITGTDGKARNVMR